MVLPLFHVNAQLVTTVMPLVLGAQVAMWERFSASHFWAEVARFEPVTFSSVPTMLAALLHAPGADEAESNTLRFVICGAAPLSPALFRRFEEKFGLKIMEGYGLTEGTCCTTINPFTGPAQDRLGRAADARPGGGDHGRARTGSSPTAAPAKSASAGRT